MELATLLGVLRVRYVFYHNDKRSGGQTSAPFFYKKQKSHGLESGTHGLESGIPRGARQLLFSAAAFRP